MVCSSSWVKLDPSFLDKPTMPCKLGKPCDTDTYIWESIYTPMRKERQIQIPYLSLPGWHPASHLSGFCLAPQEFCHQDFRNPEFPVLPGQAKESTDTPPPPSPAPEICTAWKRGTHARKPATLSQPSGKVIKRLSSTLRLGFTSTRSGKGSI